MIFLRPPIIFAAVAIRMIGTGDYGP
jgi:hypothetical protein